MSAPLAEGMKRVTLEMFENLTVLRGYSPTSLLSAISNSWEGVRSLMPSKSRLGWLANWTWTGEPDETCVLAVRESDDARVIF